jgi:arsenate reductase
MINESPAILRNPHYPQSCQALALIGQRGITPRGMGYLKNPYQIKELQNPLGALGLSSRQRPRRHEALYKALALDDPK